MRTKILTIVITVLTIISCNSNVSYATDGYLVSNFIEGYMDLWSGTGRNSRFVNLSEGSFVNDGANFISQIFQVGCSGLAEPITTHGLSFPYYDFCIYHELRTENYENTLGNESDPSLSETWLVTRRNETAFYNGHIRNYTTIYDYESLLNWCINNYENGQLYPNDNRCEYFGTNDPALPSRLTNGCDEFWLDMPDLAVGDIIIGQLHSSHDYAAFCVHSVENGTALCCAHDPNYGSDIEELDASLLINLMIYVYVYRHNSEGAQTPLGLDCNCEK